MRNSSFSTSLHRLSCSRLHRYYSGLRLPAFRLTSSFLSCLSYLASTLRAENAGSPTVDASLLYCMNGSFGHRRVYMSIALSFMYMLTSVRLTTSSSGNIGFRCSIAIPTAMLFTLRSIMLPYATQNSLPVPRLTAYRVGVSVPLCEAPFRAL